MAQMKKSLLVKMPLPVTAPVLARALNEPPALTKRGRGRLRTATTDPFGVSWPKILSQEVGQQWNLHISQREVGKATGDAGAKTQAFGNPYPHSIFIRDVQFWNGLGLDDIVDMWTRMWICGGIYDPPMPIISHCKDRYGRTTDHKADPAPPLGDRYYELIQGGWLTVSVQAGTVSGNPFGYQTQFTLGFEIHRPTRNAQIINITADALEVQGLQAEKAILEQRLIAANNMKNRAVEVLGGK
jgi:hypothetical protein